ncbi:MAG TPA: AmmeMemoRadiSam system radical SAM enzyme [Micromonosporaceae bacterium]
MATHTGDGTAISAAPSDGGLRIDDPYTVPTRHWHALDDGRIQCDVCPRACRLRDGQRGLCFVRGRIDDQIVLASYGRSSGFCVDPIEKKPLNHFLPGTPVLSFGTAGCNLACRFCQNWDISKSREIDTLSSSASPDALADAAERLGCRSVAFTYNDPVIFMEYAMDVADACRERGIKAVAVSAGYMSPAPRAEFYQHMDAANIDLKAFTEDFYKKITFSRLGVVLETLEYLRHETDVWFEITTLLIPGHNDSDTEVAEQSRWLVEHLGPDVPLHFSAFHPDFKMTDVPRTPPETLSRARRIALDTGLKYVYTGNVHDPEGQTTHCPGCGEPVVLRDWYVISRYRLDDRGHCTRCGTAVPGVYQGPVGDWGRRRHPVRLLDQRGEHGPQDRRGPHDRRTGFPAGGAG